MDGQAGEELSRAARQCRERHEDLEVPKTAMSGRQAYGNGRRDLMRRR
jgi:hypothetical protein